MVNYEKITSYLLGAVGAFAFIYGTSEYHPIESWNRGLAFVGAMALVSSGLDLRRTTRNNLENHLD